METARRGRARMSSGVWFGALLGGLIGCGALAFAETPQALFETHCATCHAVNNPLGAPSPDGLRQMSWKTILNALDNGKMKGVGEALPPTQREALAKYLGTVETPAMPAAAACSGRFQSSKNAPSWNGWADPANTRFQSRQAAGLTAQSTRRLKLKWAFGFPGVTTAFGTPTIFSGQLFVGAADGSVYALDAGSGCVHWTYAALAGVRGSPVASADGRAVYFGDLRGNVYAVNSGTGALLWKTRVGEHPLAVITGSLKLDAGRLYVPVSGRDESIAATNPKYECCTFRGSVVALDAVSGKTIWTAFTVAETPKVTGRSAAGTQTWGPSGVAIWSSPTLDLKTRVLYAGTGVNYSNPPTETSDAIVAISMETGRILWSRQFTPADSYNFACGAKDKTNCPKDPFIDADLGSSGVLVTLPGGKRVLLASDKGGMVYGIDPDHEGKILWQRKIAAGGVQGGTMWGAAADRLGTAYVGISDFTAGKPEAGGGLVALQLATGEKLWETPAPKPTCLGVTGCSAAQPAPVTAIPGVVFLGSWDGHIRGYETKTGAIVWDFDTAQEFKSVNGVKTRGGSINSMAPVIAGGALYITSGYSGAAMPGNALLAFSVDGK